MTAWLDSLGLFPAGPEFAHLTGAGLLTTSQAELEGLGLSGTEAAQLVERIQHLRHGLPTVRLVIAGMRIRFWQKKSDPGLCTQTKGDFYKSVKKIF